MAAPLPIALQRLHLCAICGRIAVVCPALRGVSYVTSVCPKELALVRSTEGFVTRALSPCSDRYDEEMDQNDSCAW